MSLLRRKRYLDPISKQPYHYPIETGFGDPMTVVEKINDIILQLNKYGDLNEEMVQKWNEVYRWVSEEGLDKSVIERIRELVEDGTFKDMINDEMIMDLFREQIKNFQNIAVNITDFGYKGDDPTKDTEAINTAINYTNNRGGGTVVFPPDEKIIVEDIDLYDKDNIVLDGNGAKLFYSEDVPLRKSPNGHNVFDISYSDRIKIKNMVIYGNMFKDLNKDNLPREPISNSATYRSRAIYGQKIGSVSVEDVTTFNFSHTIFVEGGKNLIFKDSVLNDTYRAFNIFDTENVDMANVIVENARYSIARISRSVENAGVGTTGSGGTSFLFYNSSGHLKNCVSRYAATDGFRIQDGSNFVFEDCLDYKSRRNGFSIYGQNEKSIGDYIRCRSVNTSDYLFWSGTTNTNRFRRPTEQEPYPFVSTENNNEMRLVDCVVKTHRQPRKLTNDTFFKSYAPSNYVNFKPNSVGCSVVNTHFSGLVLNYGVDSQGDRSSFANNTIEYISDYDKTTRAVFILGDDLVINNNTVYGGDFGFWIGYEGDVGAYIRDNKSYGYGISGYEIYSDGAIVIDNHAIQPAGGDTTVYGFRVRGNNVVFDKNAVIDNINNVVDRGLLVYSSVNTIYLGDFKSAIDPIGYEEKTVSASNIIEM